MLIPAQSYAENRSKECNSIHSSTILSISYELDWYTNQSNPNLHTPTRIWNGLAQMSWKHSLYYNKIFCYIFFWLLLPIQSQVLLLLSLLYNSLHSYSPLWSFSSLTDCKNHSIWQHSVLLNSINKAQDRPRIVSNRNDNFYRAGQQLFSNIFW